MTQKATAALLVFGLMHIVRAGPLDAALNWARADKLPIEIDVNLPWLPCKFQFEHFFFFSFPFVCLRVQYPIESRSTSALSIAYKR